jgi:hypothetical protein
MDINEPPFMYCFDGATASVAEEDNAIKENQPAGAGTERARILAFDDGVLVAEEYISGIFQAPPGLNTAGDAIIHMYWTAAASAADKTVDWVFAHLPLADGEDWDGAYNDVAMGALAAPAADGGSGAALLVYDTTTISLSSLGWVADDMVEIRLARDGDDAVNDTLVGDAWVVLLCVELPVLQ